jgi:hypothetical protein
MKTIYVDPNVGCYGEEYGRPCPFKCYAGGPDACAVCGSECKNPAPLSCPLRIDGSIVVISSISGR